MKTTASDLICITSRTLCPDDFLARLARIAREAPRAVILREKDLPEAEYARLAAKVLELCRQNGVLCILHSFPGAAVSLGAEAIHLPMPALRRLGERDKAHFSVLGASCHSAEEAVEAEKLGCTYLTAGHIFATDCKRGVPPRGLSFLESVCQSVSIPVYAIGGINSKNHAAIRQAGAAGICVMSGLMRCSDVGAYMKEMEL